MSYRYTKCVWSGVSILILDEFIIDPPYDKVQHKEGSAAPGIERVALHVCNFQLPNLKVIFHAKFNCIYYLPF